MIRDLKMPHLSRSTGSYSAGLLQSWTDGDYRMLTSSGASDYLKEILVEKARKRGGTRWFFGEAFVATKLQHEHGWYGSFKWLMSSRWAQEDVVPERQQHYRNALWEYFGKGPLEELQRRARSLYAEQQDKMRGKKPATPDLWLIDRDDNHEFIEVKLPGDWIKPHQLAGLALIASCLPAERVSVRIVTLFPATTDHLDLREDVTLPENLEQKTFREWCALIASAEHDVHPLAHHEIQWIDADCALEGLGHGVEFRHKAVPDETIAFADGFAWLKEPGAPVSVSLVTKPLHGISTERWSAIVQETRSAIEDYFARRRSLETTFGRNQVRAWWNA